MQIPKDTSENPNMHGIGVAVLSEDRDQVAVLQHRLESTNLGRTVFSRIGFPVGPTDPILRQIQERPGWQNDVQVTREKLACRWERSTT